MINSVKCELYYNYPLAIQCSILNKNVVWDKENKNWQYK